MIPDTAAACRNSKEKSRALFKENTAIEINKKFDSFVSNSNNDKAGFNAEVNLVDFIKIKIPN